PPGNVLARLPQDSTAGDCSRAVGGRAGVARPPSANQPQAKPMSAPASTSDGQCTPVYTRETAMSAASAQKIGRATGKRRPVASAPATADAACPDGSDEVS